MISTFVLSGGNRIRVQTLHPAGSVSIVKTSPGGQSLAEMFIPADMCGVVAQAIEQAGRMVETGPCAKTGDCNAQECALGLVACPRASVCVKAASHG